MANAVRIEEKQVVVTSGYRLELTVAEMIVLRDVLANIGGDPVRSNRIHVNSIIEALNKVYIPTINYPCHISTVPQHGIVQLMYETWPYGVQ